MIVSDVLNNSMRATNCVYANHRGEIRGEEKRERERERAMVDFPRMRDKTRVEREEGGSVSAPHGAEKVGNASVSGVCVGRVSLTSVFPRGSNTSICSPLDHFTDNRSRPLIKPNITSEGLSKLLREMN